MNNSQPNPTTSISLTEWLDALKQFEPISVILVEKESDVTQFPVHITHKPLRQKPALNSLRDALRKAHVI